ncbi:beta-N-acetylhexosaminidase [bacterium AH-315-G05]|nr:beta-N-acetylhexosaminidase [bacterium AH-315-G05]
MIKQNIIWIMIIINTIVGFLIQPSMNIFEIKEFQDEMTSIVEENKQDETDLKIKNLINNMTIEEKIGQMIMVSFYEHQIHEFISNKRIGGFILFSNNVHAPMQTRELTGKIDEITKIYLDVPPFIAIDQEGGKVSRIDSIFPSFENNRVLGNIDDSELSKEQGLLIGEALSYLGVNLNFAPVVDVNTNENNPVIGVRAFGENAEIVSKMANAFVNGQRKNLVISCIKHFPGHGNVMKDSHFELPTNYRDISEVREIDISPFKYLINESDIGMIMTAHVKVPSMDTEQPATLSRKILTGELRDRLGFEGVIITDDIGSMEAITSLMKTEEAAVKAIEAGVDIVLLVTTLEQVEKTIEYILYSIKNGVITEERIDESLYRILRLKYRYGFFSEKEVTITHRYEELYKRIKEHAENVRKRASELN